MSLIDYSTAINTTGRLRISKTIKCVMIGNNITVLEWFNQNLTMKLIKNLWSELNTGVIARRSSNLKDWELIDKNEWTKLNWKKMVRNHRNCLKVLLLIKNYPLIAEMVVII